MTTVMLSPILHCVRYHTLDCKQDNSLSAMEFLKRYVMFTRSDAWEYTETRVVYHQAWSQPKCRVIVKGASVVSILSHIATRFVNLAFDYILRQKKCEKNVMCVTVIYTLPFIFVLVLAGLLMCKHATGYRLLKSLQKAPKWRLCTVINRK